MGRLILNVLLSFAQFEREVTGERIRDKVAASKAKGLRMGGRPPLGYDISDGRLVVNAEEARRARRIFERYLDLGNLKALEREGVESKRWRNLQGELVGGGCMTRGALHYLLTNPVYRGITRHKDKTYEDTHPAIVDAALWESVQTKLRSSNASQPDGPLNGEPAPLHGKLSDDRGNPMVPVHTKRGMKRYRYYLSRASLTGRGEPGSIHRLASGLVEQFLIERLAPHLADGWMPQQPPERRVFAAIERARVAADEITVQINPLALAAATENSLLRLPFHLRRKRGAQVIGGHTIEATPSIDRVLVRGVVLAQQWARELELGDVPSLSALAQREGICRQYAARLLPLAYLAPQLVERIITGRQPRSMTLQALTSEPMPITWERQRAWFERLAA